MTKQFLVRVSYAALFGLFIDGIYRHDNITCVTVFLAGLAFLALGNKP